MQNTVHCLATDLDGTFVGDQQALKALLRYYEHLPERVSLIYITGRHLDSALELMQTENLPKPDLLATDIGISLYSYQGGDWIIDPLWDAQMKKDWQPQEILKVAAQFSDLQRQKLPDDRRVSFYANSLNVVKAFEFALKNAGIPHQLIYSSGRDLDILPAAGGKAPVLEYIINQNDLHTANLLVAGDSGNDLDMLSLGYPSVIVGNGLNDLSQLEDRDTLYRAKEHCAGGILEAWQHFYPLTKQKMSSGT